MKYYFIMLLSIILSLSCYSKGLNLKLEIERNYEIDIGSISKESIFKGVKESKKGIFHWNVLIIFVKYMKAIIK